MEKLISTEEWISTEKLISTEELIYHIYDRIFKRIFTLSNLAIINLINGLFETNYPTDSEVEYPNREHVNRKLKDKFADIFITINREHTYHLEAQMSKDKNIVVRVFEYSFQYALENMGMEDTLEFPEPVVIYLNDTKNIPEESVLTLEFKGQGSFQYRVKNFIYQKKDLVELNRKKLIILIPFQLLKLRALIEKEPSKENFQLLQNMIQNDIVESVEANFKVGNITMDDANQILELTAQLYHHIYEQYMEKGECQDMKPLLDGALELPMDKYRIRIDELEQGISRIEEEKARAEAEKAKAEKEKAKAEAEKAKVEKEKAKAEAEKAMAEKERVNAEEQAARAKKEKEELTQEILHLKAKLKELENKA